MQIASSPSMVRPATTADQPSIWHLFNLLHQENGAFSMSEPKVQYLLDRVLHPERINPGDMGLRGWMGVIGPVNNIEAFILLILGSYWYSDDFMLEELANFVHPAHRKGTKHAETLLEYTKYVQAKLQIPLMIGIVSNKRTEAKVRLYRRHFPVAGAFFMYGRDENHQAPVNGAGHGTA